MSDKTPVSVLTGFLGSGKTTLLNRILTEEHGLRIAVIENEYSDIGIDQDLIINIDEEFIQLNNGCICCRIRGDLIKSLNDIADRKDKFDRVLIETTGLANPGPVAQTFLVDPGIREKYTIDGIITLVDSKHIGQHLDKNSDEALAQIAFADRIMINKVDLVDEVDLTTLERRVKRINKVAQVYRSTMADAPISELLDIGGFNLDHALEIDPEFFDDAEDSKSDNHDHHHDHENYHDHDHDDEVQSLAFSLPGWLDMNRINLWFQVFIKAKGADLYRIKGILAVDGSDEQIVFQGVHKQFGTTAGKSWEGKEPVNRLIFIGRDLDEEIIKKSLISCLVSSAEEGSTLSLKF